jgi:putative membrane protein
VGAACRRLTAGFYSFKELNMKPLIPVLTLAIAAALVGCNSDGSMRSASNDDAMHHDTMAQNTANNTNAVATADPAAADPQLRMVPKGPLPIAKDDQIFLTDATAGGIFEVEASKKALAKTTDDGVRMIAQHMIDDHTRVNDQLGALSQRKGMNLGTLPNADQIGMLSKLDGLSGSDFDREYLGQQRRAHEEAISLFQSTANNSPDRDIRNFAALVLPTLRGHLDQLNNRINSPIGLEK